MHDSIRQRLREATAAQHERVDAAFSGFDLESLEGYRAFLQAHLRVVRPLETGLEEAGITQLINDWPNRQRRHALLADLADLGGLGQLPDTSLNIQPSAGWCLGACYVLEGSRLGGRLLARRVANANPTAPLRYLAHTDTSPSWPRFLEQLEREARLQPWQDVLAGASACFALFIRHAAPSPATSTAAC